MDRPTPRWIAEPAGMSRGTNGGCRVVEEGDVELARRVVDELAGRPICVAESCTAGRVATTLACVEDVQDVLRGGLVAYQVPVKRALLGVTAVSVLTTAAAEQMAAGACRLFDAPVGIATTGLAGGDPTDGVEPGTVFVATVIDGDARSRRHRFEGGPQAVCDQAARQALVDLLDHAVAARSASSPR
jgi:PncC family amidohydrolase